MMQVIGLTIYKYLALLQENKTYEIQSTFDPHYLVSHFIL